MKNKLIKSDGYEKLVANINKELNNLELLIKQSTVLTYWRIGRYISEDILENKDRASYGKSIYKRLADEVPLGAKTLVRTVRFYRAWPIWTDLSKLSWTHFIYLLTVKDISQRKLLQHQALKEDWDSEQLRKHIQSFKQKQAKPKPEEIPQLEFTRGQLHVYKLIESESELSIDLGFQMRRRGVLQYAPTLQSDDCIEVVQNGEDDSIKKILIQEESLFTYIAKVEDEGVIDGDTIEAVIYCDFKMKIIQTLRFRGIDCPEIDTPEGKLAKKFVEDRLKGLEFIVVKTYKDRSDKYDRYLADIFYKRGETDPQKVADTGNFLNQELLDAGLAKKV